MLNHQVFVGFDLLSGIDHQMSIPAQSDFEPGQPVGRGTAHDSAAGIKDTAVAGAMEAGAGQIDGATEVCAYRRGGAPKAWACGFQANAKRPLLCLVFA